MIWLILGVALWWGAHLFKRLAPARRARLGDGGRGLVAGALLISVVLMVIGYRAADGAVFWGRSPMLTGINNLLLLLAFYLFAASGMKTRAARLIRHPQLTGFSLWAVGHLIVNGDVPSFVLFGGLLAWALVEIALINSQDKVWTRPEPAATAKEVQAIIGAVIVFGVIAAIHGWIGPSVFG